MVEQVDVEEPAGGERLGGQVEVVGARRRVAGGVVVDEDHRRRALADRIAEELSDANEGGAHVPLVDGDDPEDGVLRREEDDPQLLSLELTHLRHDPVGDVPG